MHVFIASFTIIAALFCYHSESAGLSGTRETMDAARECLQQKLPQKLLGELYKTAHHDKNSFLKDDNKHKKLLPKFARTLKTSRGISVLREMLDFYYNDVFGVESLDINHKENILNFLSRLRNEVHYCSGLHPRSLSSKDRNHIRKMRKMFVELKDAGVNKAIGEFKTVLDWIDTYLHQKKGKENSRRKRQ